MAIPQQLPLRLHNVLKAIYDYTQENGKPPYRNNQSLSEMTGYASNHITNIKSELKKYQYIDDNLHLQKLGEDYIKIHFDPFTVRNAEIRLQGKVRAGIGEDVIVNNAELDIPSDETISIPGTIADKDTFALKVDGRSMEALGIFPGDFVIVEKSTDHWWPKPQDVIIAKYLPHVPNRGAVDNVDPDEYIGPVLKVYHQRFGEKGCELGWRRNNESNPYFIKADDLIPIGKVTGVFRSLISSSLF